MTTRPNPTNCSSRAIGADAEVTVGLVCQSMSPAQVVAMVQELRGLLAPVETATDRLLACLDREEARALAEVLACWRYQGIVVFVTLEGPCELSGAIVLALFVLLDRGVEKLDEQASLDAPSIGGRPSSAARAGRMQRPRD